MNAKVIAKYVGVTAIYSAIAYLVGVGMMITVGAIAFWASKTKVVSPAQQGRLGMARRRTRRNPSSSRPSR